MASCVSFSDDSFALRLSSVKAMFDIDFTKRREDGATEGRLSRDQCKSPWLVTKQSSI